MQKIQFIYLNTRERGEEERKYRENIFITEKRKSKKRKSKREKKMG